MTHGGSVVEVRNLHDNDGEPKETSWVLIEKMGENFSVTGKAQGKTIDASFAPRGFDTAEQAIKASVTWADLLGIPVIYVREPGQAPNAPPV
jgi:hypothetical protein